MVVTVEDIVGRLRSTKYDFIDFGCSKGNSIRFAMSSLGGKRGIGIDLSEDKVRQTRAAGFEAECADARHLLRAHRAVSFVTMIDFLEHLAGVKDASICIRSASTVASDFVFIHQPWFDSDGQLLRLGVKLYWSDWEGHRNAMSSLEFRNILVRDPNIAAFRIYGTKKITDSADPAVHPVDSPMDQQQWVEDAHPPKPTIDFGFPVYNQIAVVALVNSTSTSFEDIERRFVWTDVIYSWSRP